MICLETVSKSFGDLTVLDGVDLSVERGEFVGLVGPNGSGKTTLLRTINGVLEPDAGAVWIDDDRIGDLSSKAVSREIATVPQNTHVGFAFPAEAIVEMGRTPHRSRLDWTDRTDPIERALERTETTHLRDRSVGDLSGGERQRVLIARALAGEPDAMVLDEPTANLDINHQIRVLELVEELVGNGLAAIAAIHDLDLAARYCDRLALLHEGTIRSCGRPDAVLSDATLGTAFGTAAAVTRNPVTGTPTVTAITDRPQRDAHVHVAGRGAPGVRALRRLWTAGFEVSIGIVPDGDAAAVLTRELGARAVTAPPFSPPGETQRREAKRLAGNADVVVTTGATEAGAPYDTQSDIRVQPGGETAGVRSDGGDATTVEATGLVPAVLEELSNEGAE